MSDVLNSWKEIAAYLNAGLRTVQRWERERQLPVRRVGDGARAPVLALKSDIDAWVRTRKRGVRKLRSEEFRYEISRTEELLNEARLLTAKNANLRHELRDAQVPFRNNFTALRECLREMRSKQYQTANLRKFPQAESTQSGAD